MSGFQVEIIQHKGSIFKFRADKPLVSFRASLVEIVQRSAELVL